MDNKDLQELYLKVKEFCLAKFNDEIDFLKIELDGNLVGVSYSDNRYDEDREYSINFNDLSEDLLVIAEERLEREREERRVREIEKERQKKLQEERDQQIRYRNYLLLKKEFEK